MTRFDHLPSSNLENAARNLLSHVEAAAEREKLPFPAEAQALGDILCRLDRAVGRGYRYPLVREAVDKRQQEE